jgi:hypothetical protein
MRANAKTPIIVANRASTPMSFYNKWNDTVATTLEKPPFDMASGSLSWWSAGKHLTS